MIEDIILKVVHFGYDSLTERERFIYDKYQAALEHDQGCCNE